MRYASRLQRLWAACDRFPRVPIVSAPTPVRRLGGIGQDLWLKDDSLSHPVYGGNKPRKLEYLIARARESGRDILTTGFESSNHALATAYHASRFGVATHLVLVRGPGGLASADAAAA